MKHNLRPLTKVQRDRARRKRARRAARVPQTMVASRGSLSNVHRFGVRRLAILAAFLVLTLGYVATLSSAVDVADPLSPSGILAEGTW